MFMLIILLTPDTAPITRRNETEQVLEIAKYELNVLRNSTYGVPGNITGFEEVGKIGPDGSVMIMPPKEVRVTVKEMVQKVLGDDANLDDIAGDIMGGLVQGKNATEGEKIHIPVESEDASRGLGDTTSSEEATESLSKRSELKLPLGHTELPLYYNASGIVYGDWHKSYDLPPYRFTNSTKDVEKNITGTNGKITIRLEEAHPGDVQEVTARISFGSEDGYDSYDILMSGVHMVKSGDMLLTTNSRGYVQESPQFRS